MRKFPFGLSEKFGKLRKLPSPHRIQDFLDAMPINFERGGDTCRSPLVVLERNEAHCMEGAMLAAAALWAHGERPLLLDLRAAANDDDHVVALFRQGGRWGAISKTNHAVLRFRDAVYRTPGELALSYFNEYFKDSGEKTLRSYSRPFSLLAYGSEWLTAREDLWHIMKALDRSPHSRILPAGSRLRRADPLEIKAGKLVEYPA